ncbi:kininogen-1 isoform X2 [Carlito syrichta]|uniref:Kininogen-1 isoform X2 n=1 Tax=Carlito syrichta TaxID=1868482 RepID=A0A1U7T3A4_CARSF|nr:kininogen-1 isoform X2 [Carlito syrichta]
MKLIAIFFLCSRLLPSLTQEPVSEEMDCNDEDLFKAADAALKKYNSRSKSGNQFVLYRITEATKTVNPEIFYSLKYQIKEGDCPVQSDKTWQDCGYNEGAEAATGECTATVGKRENEKFVVATQTCQITPAEGPVVTAQYNCLGCVHPISTKSPDLEPVLRHGIQHFNNNTHHSHLFALSEVKQAQRQETGECIDNAYMDIHLRIASISQNCELYPAEVPIPPPRKICAGCPRDIPTNSPELKEALTHSITKLNAENNETFHFKIDTVKKASVQVVAGQKFFIEFTARETTCSKESNEELTESCETKNSGKALDCSAEVYVIPWEKKIYPTVNCRPAVMISLMKRPPGFSPFRSALIEKIGEEITKHLRSCEYKAQPPKPEAEPASEREVS